MSSGPQCEPSGPAPTNPDFDLDAFQAEFEQVAVGLGFEASRAVTVHGDSILFWRKPGRAPDAPCVFFSAGIHGDEPSGPLAVLSFLKQGGTDDKFSWIIAPVLNPAGLRRGTRENAEGIDMNRDFLQCKSIECQGITEWWEDFDSTIDLHLSLHEDWEATGFYFYAINSGPMTCVAEEIRDQMEKHLPMECSELVDDHPVSKPGLIVHECSADEPDGWPEAIYLCKKFPLLSYTLEAPGCLSIPERAEGLLIALNAIRAECLF